jgi:hypothetical protein
MAPDSTMGVVSEVSAIEPNELNDLNLADWLGVRGGIRNWLDLGLQPAKCDENCRASE